MGAEFDGVDKEAADTAGVDKAKAARAKEFENQVVLMRASNISIWTEDLNRLSILTARDADQQESLEVAARYLLVSAKEDAKDEPSRALDTLLLLSKRYRGSDAAMDAEIKTLMASISEANPDLVQCSLVEHIREGEKPISAGVSAVTNNGKTVAPSNEKECQ